MPGGGVALLRSTGALDETDVHGDQITGVDIVRRALQAPLRQIADNAGLEGSLVAQKVNEGEGAYGFNARTEQYERPGRFRRD